MRKVLSVILKGAVCIALTAPALAFSQDSIEELSRACDSGGGGLGDAVSCSLLGHAYRRGEGVRRDLHKANELFLKACNMGYARGCNDVGISYELSRGYRQDYNKANAFYWKACDLGYAVSCNNLGFSYERGLGVPQDDLKAYELYKKSCDMGYAGGCLQAKHIMPPLR